jgi:YfiH family protein
MNLGNPSGVDVQDDEGRIEENYRRLQGALGVGGRERCSVHQVHGPGVVRVAEGRAHDRKQRADALVTTDPARVLSVRVADCVPVLMASEDGRVVAAVHAGWRGVVAGAVLAAMREMGVEGRRVVAAVGPSIGEEAFEVGPEVVAEFGRVFGAGAPVRVRGDGKGHVDLKEAIRRQLVGAGVREENVDVTDRCSYRDAGEFFSHRRENGVTGRMAALIGARG